LSTSCHSIETAALMLLATLSSVVRRLSDGSPDSLLTSILAGDIPFTLGAPFNDSRKGTGDVETRTLLATIPE
jgi:hypothetical protein